MLAASALAANKRDIQICRHLNVQGRRKRGMRRGGEGIRDGGRENKVQTEGGRGILCYIMIYYDMIYET